MGASRNRSLESPDQRRLTARTFMVLIIVACAFAAALVRGVGGVSGLIGDEKVTVGEMQFSIPREWQRMPADGYAHLQGADQIKAAYCLRLQPQKPCKAAPRTAYVVLRTQRAAPRLAEVRRDLSRQLDRRFPSFRMTGQYRGFTSDRTEYLRYEFTFGPRKQRTAEILGLYRTRGKGVIVLAQGPPSIVRDERRAVLHVLQTAHEAHAAGAH